MYEIAIVEDQVKHTEKMIEYIRRYENEQGLRFNIKVFNDGQEIIDQYDDMIDVIFFDIEMPKINGMDAAKVIREKDAEVVILFITNLAQYAIEGYSVGALDFVLKPINYYAFTLRLTRALERVKKKETMDIVLNTKNGIVKINSNKLLYVEIENRRLHYHTKDSEYVIRGTLSAAEEELKVSHFVKCNQCYIVNLKHVVEVEKSYVYIGENRIKLEISRRNKSNFIKVLTDYISEG